MLKKIIKIGTDTVVKNIASIKKCIKGNLDGEDPIFKEVHTVVRNNKYVYLEPTIEFEDPEVERVLIASTNPKIDDNHNGKISVREIKRTTTLPPFENNTLIETFNELEYFLNLTSIPNRAFLRCSNLRHIKLNKNILSLGSFAFMECANLNIVVNLPNLELVFISFKSSGIKAVVNLGKVRELNLFTGQNCFHSCENLRVAILPETMQVMEGRVFAYDPSLDLIAVKATTPPTLSSEYPFHLCPLTYGIFVPSSSVDAYKTANVWSSWASKIKEIGGIDWLNAAKAIAQEEGVFDTLDGNVDWSDENIFKTIYIRED